MPIVLAPVVSVEWQWSLLDADGVEHPLNGEVGVAALMGLGGLLMPPVGLNDRELPIREGAQLLGARIRARDFEIPLLVEMETHAGLVNRHEELLSWLDPLRGPIRIRVRRPDATYREIEATYLGGLEGAETGANGVDNWWRGVASFRAHAPYWTDIEDTALTYTLDPSVGTWFPLTFPYYLAASQVIATDIVWNTGTAEAYPRWTFTGPGTTPTVRNLTTDHQFGLAVTLGVGDRVIIEMAPLTENPVRDANGNNLYAYRTVGSTPWSLRVGTNTVQIEMANATSASSVEMAYRRRWLRR